jgi:hypothetical protein
MRFIVLDSALNGNDEVLVLIDRLVDRLADEVHSLDVPAADLLQESSWYRSARQTRRKVLTTALAQPPRKQDRRGPHLKTVQVEDSDSARIADKLAHTPLVILVEDRESDGVLLEILIEELAWPALRELWVRGQKTSPRALDLVTAGGVDNIPQRLQRAVSDADTEGRPLRLLLLYDSDARWPGDEELKRKTLTKIESLCEGNSVPRHVWRKRSAENYIPDEIFIELRDRCRTKNERERFEVFLNLSCAQRDHFPIKKGLTPEEREKAVEACLYDALDASEKQRLESLAKRLIPGRQRILPQLRFEYRSLFTAEGLRQRDGRGELEQVLRSIAKEL